MGLPTAILPTTCLFLSLNTLFFVPFVVGLVTAVVGCVRIPLRAKQSVTALCAVLCISASTVPFVLRAYAGRSGKPIEIVLPVGYQGEFSIVKDRTKGKELWLHDGAWIFEIPASGVLIVKDDWPFYMWHKSFYRYSDGSPANVKSLGSGSTDYGGTEHLFEALPHF
jgi:hypothetical protein